MKIDCLSLLLKVIPKKIKNYLKWHFSVADMELSLRHLKKNGFYPAYAIDIGAYEGTWTRMYKKIFPKSAVLMIEPQTGKEKFLKNVCKRYKDCEYLIAAAGAEKKEVIFLSDESGSRVAQAAEGPNLNYSTIKLGALDDLTWGLPFAMAEFIKLDVQGYEIEVLKGAKSVLKSTEVILMEVSLISLIKGAPSFYEVIKYMREEEFRLYDICSFIRRPVDGALWQIDAIFVKETSKLGAASAGW